VVKQRLSHSLTIWVAWVAVGAAGVLLPTLAVFSIPFEVLNLSIYGAMVGVIVSATCLGLGKPQRHLA
jgi:hypothetical protein